MGRVILYLLTFVAFSLITDRVEADINPLLGKWKVATTLVSAYDPTNPAGSEWFESYDLRKEILRNNVNGIYLSF